MGGEQITARNMRSKCRCSYVLQFTFRRAVCCVLHRPPSQVIHCRVLSLTNVSALFKVLGWENTVLIMHIPSRGEGTIQPKSQAEVLTQLESSDASHGGTAPDARAAGELRKTLGLRHSRAQRGEILCRQAEALRHLAAVKQQSSPRFV